MARLPESAARRGAGAAGVSVVSVSGVVRWLLKQKGAIMRIFLITGETLRLPVTYHTVRN